ncbi:hypothetical protein LX36DRAFT_101463 [Colletotrichum falcatum]|nr:hypothetical protein LX36DRAFT_101463 [Colletotrichum falcatum]
MCIHHISSLPHTTPPHHTTPSSPTRPEDHHTHTHRAPVTPPSRWSGLPGHLKQTCRRLTHTQVPVTRRLHALFPLPPLLLLAASLFFVVAAVFSATAAFLPAMREISLRTMLSFHPQPRKRHPGYCSSPPCCPSTPRAGMPPAASLLLNPLPP